MVKVEPKNSFISTEKPIVHKKNNATNNPKSKFPFSFFTGFN